MGIFSSSKRKNSGKHGSLTNKDENISRDEMSLNLAREYRKALQDELRLESTKPHQPSESDQQLLTEISGRKKAALATDVLNSLNFFIRTTCHWRTWSARQDCDRTIPAELLRAIERPLDDVDEPVRRKIRRWNSFLGKSENVNVIADNWLQLRFNDSTFTKSIFVEDYAGFPTLGYLFIEKDGKLLLDWNCRRKEVGEILYWEVSASDSAINFIENFDWVPLIFWIEELVSDFEVRKEQKQRSLKIQSELSRYKDKR